MFSLGTMLVVLLFPQSLLCLFVVALMSGVITGVAEVPIKNYLSLLLIPLTFLFLSMLAVVIVVSPEAQGFLLALQAGSYHVGVSEESILLGGRLVLQALALITCMYFLILTTPLVDLLEMLKKMRVPFLVTELMGLIYRFIFILLDEVNKITTAQQSRLGYRNFKTMYRSSGQLASGLLVKGLRRTRQMNQGLLAWCYQGELKVLELDYSFSKKNLFLIIAIEIFLIVVGIRLGGL